MSVKELLGEELFEKVQEKLGEDDKLFLASENDGEYIPRDKFNEIKSEIDDLKDQKNHYKEMANDYKEKLNDFADLAEENEELQKEIKAVKEEKEETENQFQSKLQEKDLHHEVDLILKDAKARDIKSTKVHLDMEKIKEADDKRAEIEKQTEELQKTHDFLFGETGLEGDDVETGDGKVDGDIKNNPWEPGKVNLTKQAELLQDNPGKAKKLIEKAGGNPSDYGL